MSANTEDSIQKQQPKKQKTADNSGSDDASQIEILSGWFCPYAQRAWMALEEKCAGKYTLTEAMENIPAQKCMIKLPLLLEKNPNGKVPVILDRSGRKGENDKDDEEVIVYESLICVEYIDEATTDNAGPTTLLLPGSPAQRAHARMWATKLNDGICTQFYVLLLKQDKKSQDEAADKILRGLREFSKECKGPFFYGNEFSIVDIALAPWGFGIRMDVLKHYRHFEVPRDDEEYATYWQWVDAVSKRPSFVATASNDLPAMINVYLPYAEGTGYTKSVVKGEI